MEMRRGDSASHMSQTHVVRFADGFRPKEGDMAVTTDNGVSVTVVNGRVAEYRETVEAGNLSPPSDLCHGTDRPVVATVILAAVSYVSMLSSYQWVNSWLLKSNHDPVGAVGERYLNDICAFGWSQSPHADGTLYTRIQHLNHYKLQRVTTGNHVAAGKLRRQALCLFDILRVFLYSMPGRPLQSTQPYMCGKSKCRLRLCTSRFDLNTDDHIVLHRLLCTNATSTTMTDAQRIGALTALDRFTPQIGDKLEPIIGLFRTDTSVPWQPFATDAAAGGV